MHTLGRTLRALGRGFGRAIFFAFIVVVAMFPLPVMPIVLAIQKRRRLQLTSQVDRGRSSFPDGPPPPTARRADRRRAGRR
jgi:hypothetical protein